MDNEIMLERSVSADDFDSVAPEPGSMKVDISDGMSSHGEVNGELGRVGELLTRVELYLACSSEKLVNLSILTMQVAARESDFESFTSENNSVLIDSAEKALEFDLFTGILDSEVKELDKIISSLQSDMSNAHEMISTFRHLEKTSLEMEKKLHDSEESLKQSQEHVSEIKVQCAKFQRTLSYLDGTNNWTGDKGLDLAEDFNAKMRMQTAKEQRHILRMLEKSLAREMDLEKKLTESRQIEEELKLRLLSREQELFCTGKEGSDIYGRCFEAENAAEVLTGISKDLLNQQQMLQFILNSSIQRETGLRSKLDGSMEKLEAKESALQKLESSNARVIDFLKAQNDSLKASLTEAEDKLILANSEVFTLRESVSSLENQLKESESTLLNEQARSDESQEQHNALCSEINELENAVEDLKEKLSKTENRAESAEAKCKLLNETNIELNEELGHLKNSSMTPEKLEALEKQLKLSDIQLEHAIASIEASQEKQNMLYSTIEDMGDLIEDLKLKVSKAESRAEDAEGKCTVLSESNAELSEELSFLRGRLECLEASLNQAEEMKMTTAKDIDIRTKLITNLLSQLAVERERLHRQISALAVENKILIVKLMKTDKNGSVVLSHENKGNFKELIFSRQDLAAAPARESEEETKLSAAGSEVEKTQTTESVGETEMKPADNTSEFENVRRIDGRLVNFKHIFMALVVLMISFMAYFFHQNKLRI